MGEIGSGKTLLAKCMIESLRKKRDFLRDDIMIKDQGPDYKPILTSALNAES